eukprot:11821428-Alexandrium_andersonii.AAC.1
MGSSDRLASEQGRRRVGEQGPPRCDGVTAADRGQVEQKGDDAPAEQQQGAIDHHRAAPRAARAR